MSNYRFILEPYKSPKNRIRCPKCGRQGQFAPYVDVETGERISNEYGRCNREDKCGHHVKPSIECIKSNVNVANAANAVVTTNYLQNNIFGKGYKITALPAFATLSNTIPQEIYSKSLNPAFENNFTKYLKSLFGVDVANQLIKKYNIGTSKHWPGATVFWQVDIDFNVRRGKIMLYNLETGKRVKSLNATWVHYLLKLEKPTECFFGEHLIAENPFKPISIVESEKTAIISSIFLPQFTWIASGGKQGLQEAKCKVLEGKNVVLWPDVNAYDKWKLKAEQYGFEISDLLEKKATDEEKAIGSDLADFLVKRDESTGWAVSAQGYPLFWDL